MEQPAAIEAFSALAHKGRLSVFRLLMTHAPNAVSEEAMAAALEMRSSKLESRLQQLEAAGLVQSRRDGGEIVYAADTERAGELIALLAADPSEIAEAAIAREVGPRLAPFGMVFACEGAPNLALLAAAVLERASPERFHVHVASAQPSAPPHPAVREQLDRLDAPYRPERVGELRSLMRSQELKIDFVITMGDRAVDDGDLARRRGAIAAHWSLPDPADSVDPCRAAERLREALAVRLVALSVLPIEQLDTIDLQRKIETPPALAGRGMALA